MVTVTGDGVAGWACIRLLCVPGSRFIIHSSCSFSPMFGKHQLSQRTKSLFPQPAFLSPCRMPGAVKYCTYRAHASHGDKAELGLKLPVLALWGPWGHAGGSHRSLCLPALLASTSVTCLSPSEVPCFCGAVSLSVLRTLCWCFGWHLWLGTLQIETDICST